MTDMIDMKKTGQRLKWECDMQGLSVKMIQEKLGIGAFQSVYNWFSGKTLPSLDNFYELSKILKVPMEWLIVDQYPKELRLGYIQVGIGNIDMVRYSDSRRNRRERMLAYKSCMTILF